MNIGAHVSAAGGVSNAPERAAAMNAECFQFFTRSPQGGKDPGLTADQVDGFLAACGRLGLDSYHVHAPFIINLASASEKVRQSSAEIITSELEKCDRLGARDLVVHVGSASGVGESQGLSLVIEGLKGILGGHGGMTRLLIEVSAGTGMVIGDRFEEIRSILDGVGDPRLGVCLDTAHAFASGYDLRSPEAVNRTADEFERQIGLSALSLVHANDSRVGLGERKDRHEHIGRGKIGLDGFRAVIGSPRLSGRDFIVETRPDRIAEDVRILIGLRRELAAGKDKTAGL